MPNFNSLCYWELWKKKKFWKHRQTNKKTHGFYILDKRLAIIVRTFIFVEKKDWRNFVKFFVFSKATSVFKETLKSVVESLILQIIRTSIIATPSAMEQFARPPQELSSDGPMDVNWRSWKQQFLIFLKASGAVNKDQDYKASLLMNLMGSVGQQVFQNFNFESPRDLENMDIIIEKFDNYYDPKKSEAYERNLFWTSRKKNEDSIDEYVKELKVKYFSKNNLSLNFTFSGSHNS